MTKLDVIMASVPRGKAVLVDGAGQVVAVVDDQRTGMQRATDELMVWLRTERQLKGITQEELAAALGVSAREVSRWETGVVRIPGPRLGQLRTLFAEAWPTQANDGNEENGDDDEQED